MEEIKKEEFERFAKLHPIEAYELDKQQFYEFAEKFVGKLSHQEIDDLVKSMK